LDYTKPKKNANLAPDRIIALLFENPVLRDEAFFQLIKQTRNNPKQDSLVKTW
jgi:hypothetical protein